MVLIMTRATYVDAQSRQWTGQLIAVNRSEILQIAPTCIDGVELRGVYGFPVADRTGGISFGFPA